MRRVQQRLGVWMLAVVTGLLPGLVTADPLCPPPMPLLPEVVDSAAQDRGMLWRISRDGRASWLFGTVHVGKPGWQRFGPRLSVALWQSDVLALEIDPSDPSLAAAMVDAGPSPTLPSAVQARMDRAFERACLSGSALSGLPPVMQAALLGVLEARWLGLDARYALEHLLVSQARVDGLRVVALETPAQQRAALLPGDPAESLAALEQSLGQLEDRSARRVLERLVQAWEKGDLDTLARYEQWCECIRGAEDLAAMVRLNDERNPALAAGIAAQHAAGKRVFAAVGALHMTGPKALPRLLEDRGFKVERIGFERR